jgi:hypothetical protein
MKCFAIRKIVAPPGLCTFKSLTALECYQRNVYDKVENFTDHFLRSRVARNPKADRNVLHYYCRYYVIERYLVLQSEEQGPIVVDRFSRLLPTNKQRSGRKIYGSAMTDVPHELSFIQLLLIIFLFENCFILVRDRTSVPSAAMKSGL